MKQFTTHNNGLPIHHNVMIKVIDSISGEIVSTYTGHNAATNSLLVGVSKYLVGDSILNQGFDLLRPYVPQYISLGTMGLLNQEASDTGLPLGIGSENSTSIVERYQSYMNQIPGYGADGYDAYANNGRRWFGLGPPYAQRPDKNHTINCELISNSFPRTPITFRAIVPETQSERPETIDILYSAMISVGALAQFREPNKDYLFITEAGLWSDSTWSDSGENGLLAGYRIVPYNEANWNMADNTPDPATGKTNREILQENILRVEKNQVVQVIWKIQIGSVAQIPIPHVYVALFQGGPTAEGTAPAQIISISGASFILPENTFTRPNYKFVDWELQEDTHVVVSPGDAYIMPDHNIVFHAVWQIKVLDDYTPEEINDITISGQAPNIWNVGDRYNISLNGTVGAQTFTNDNSYDAFIIGFDHNEAIEGSNTIHMQFAKKHNDDKNIAFVDSSYNSYGSTPAYRMNTTNTNTGGWEASYMRNTICPQFLAALPTEWQAIITDCPKWTNNLGANATPEAVTETQDKIFLLSAPEVIRPAPSWCNPEESNKTTQYAYYANNNVNAQRIKYKSSDPAAACYWWLRSPNTNRADDFCSVDAGGSMNSSGAYYSRGFAPGFILGSINASYQIISYLENLLDNDYTQHQIIQCTGRVGQITTVVAAPIQYFTPETIIQQTITVDNTATVKIYYNRNTYQLIWNFNGGVVTPVDNYYTLDGIYKSGTLIKFPQSLISNTRSQIAIITKHGYIFDGWFEDSQFSIPITPENFKILDHNINIYAKWKALQYTITFNKNSDFATGVMNNQIFNFGEAQNLLKCTFVNPGYTFLGWATAANSTVVSYIDEQSVNDLTSEPEGIIILYAVWQVIENSTHYTVVGMQESLDTFSDYTPQQIQSIIRTGQAKNIWHVGDHYNIPLNGTVGAQTFTNDNGYDAFIIGFDHNEAIEGSNTIHMQFAKKHNDDKNIAFVDSSYNTAGSTPAYRMNITDTNTGGWEASYMRNTICPQFLAALPAEWQAIITDCPKWTNNLGANTTPEAVTETQDKIFLLSAPEVIRPAPSGCTEESNKTTQYAYYANNNVDAQRIKYKSSDPAAACDWWLRSSSASGANHFCYVYTGGSFGFDFADDSKGFAPGFKIS